LINFGSTSDEAHCILVKQRYFNSQQAILCKN